MVNQYPDSITLTVRQEPTQDANGIYQAPTGSRTVYTSNCRAEANSQNRKLSGRDGASIDYAFTVYTPPLGAIIPDGTEYSLATLQNGTFTGKIKRAINGQFNSTLWL
jgi:hypothetical protein